MIEQLEPKVTPVDEVAQQEIADAQTHPVEPSSHEHIPAMSDVVPSAAVEAEVPAADDVNHMEESGIEDRDRHARAGREGARRVHQLIQEGKLYEQEHGLKRGRQRLRQLIELGKLYEQEHDLRPARPKKRRQRLSHLGRQELLATFLDCLLRIAKPSFRKELLRFVELLRQEQNDPAA
ncbi:MAG TPA: hypothetical protein VH682_04125 [Gemmataceae bacterium]|jgi:hypothetical protein